MQMCIS